MNVHPTIEDYSPTDDKRGTEFIDAAEIGNADRPNRRLEAPELVRCLTQEDRVRTERALVRKIDLRLMPAIIIMYIMVSKSG